MIDVAAQLRKKAFTIYYSTGKKSVFNSACDELVESDLIIKLEDALAVLANHIYIPRRLWDERPVMNHDESMSPMKRVNDYARACGEWFREVAKGVSSGVEAT